MSTPAPIVVIGAGIAGLTTALSLKDRDIVLITRGELGVSGSTPYAQGGIAAAMGPGDKPALHAKDTITAGAYFNDTTAVEFLTSSAAGAVVWLLEQGVQFDKTGDSFQLCVEGGHGKARILHAGGDATGREISSTLSANARNVGNIEILENSEVTDLIIVAGAVVGIGFITGNGQRKELAASAVVIATGGVGGLFRWSTNPPECDGSGLALAMLAGAAVQDLELMQFHPTALAPAITHELGSRLPLVSEAVRGAGATLVNSVGKRLMRGHHPLEDLAPRDVVSRCLFKARLLGEETFLDASCIGQEWPTRFPTVLKACLARDIDPRRELIPVVPAAHFHMGGIRTDVEGRTSRPGLFAVGEVACNRVHGANRLASNSLLEGVVFGRRVAAEILRGALQPPHNPIDYQCVDSAPSIACTRLNELKAMMTEALGPIRHIDTVRRIRDSLLIDHELSTSRQGLVACRMLDAAVSQGISIGAHYWQPDVANLSRELEFEGRVKR